MPNMTAGGKAAAPELAELTHNRAAADMQPPHRMRQVCSTTGCAWRSSWHLSIECDAGRRARARHAQCDHWQQGRCTRVCQPHYGEHCSLCARFTDILCEWCNNCA